MILSILAMTFVVFLSRYLFLEPKVPLKLNHHAQGLLSYSGPVVLTALWAPIVFVPNNTLSLTLANPYLLAGLATALLIWKTRNVLLSILLSMGLFLLLNAVICK